VLSSLALQGKSGYDVPVQGFTLKMEWIIDGETVIAAVQGADETPYVKRYRLVLPDEMVP